jgi:hypothetical protein
MKSFRPLIIVGNFFHGSIQTKCRIVFDRITKDTFSGVDCPSRIGRALDQLMPATV